MVVWRFAGYLRCAVERRKRIVTGSVRFHCADGTHAVNRLRSANSFVASYSIGSGYIAVTIERESSEP